MTLAAAICLDRAEDVERLLPRATVADKQTALAVAAYHGKVDGMRRLIALGADVNALNTAVQTHAVPLHNAVSSGSLAAVTSLIDAGARPDIRDTAYQSTPLDWANWYAREAGGETAKEYGKIAAFLRALAANGGRATGDGREPVE